MPLLEPKPDALLPRDGRPSPDRVPAELAGGTPEPLRSELITLMGEEKVRHRITDLVRYASDASAYRFVPQVVVVAETVQDVSAILAYARRTGRSAVFRAAGTSLNGQAQGDDILVDVRRAWQSVQVLDEARRVRVGPGTTVARANATLARHGRRLGPDPASSIAATLGGVVANNASGMNAGITANSYRTVASMTVVLPSGTVLDTAAPDADERLAAAEPELAAGLLELKREVEADAELSARIRAKYEIKNTNGYRLDALLDGETPAQILRGLMVGSEGTLGFLSELVFETLPFDRLASTALLFLPTLRDAGAAVPGFVAAGAFAAEIMDENTLRASAVMEGVPPEWAELPEGTAALLVEYRAADEAALAAKAAAAQAHLDTLTLAGVPQEGFVRDAKKQAFYWKLRKAFVTVVGGTRPSGTTLITEDFCVPPSRLADAAEALLELQREHGFTVAVAGHASAGNLHFMIAFDAADEGDVRRYAAFMDDFCRMTVERFDGSLKAEHGTGRNMAPFLELEWGAKATGLMWRIKRLFDPSGVLAPGVLLDRDPEAHLRGLKTIPEVEKVADPCIECGFCEPVCPSRDLTTTPRQRIVLRREMMRQGEQTEVLDGLVEEYGYDAVDTCAGDGSCKIACPVGIDTGVMMKGFRHARHSPAEERTAAAVAKHWGAVESGAHAAVAVASKLPSGLVGGVTRAARAVVRPDLVPEWLPEVPGAARRERVPRMAASARAEAAAVYYPACVNRIFGESDGDGPSLPEAMVAVSARAGLPVWIPQASDGTPGVVGTCCATIWHSKGYEDGNALMANRIVERAWEWTDGGRLPLVVDASSCTLGISKETVAYLTEENRERHAKLTVVDSVTWAAERLLPRLEVKRRLGRVVVHPTCSMEHLGVSGQLVEALRGIADEVVVPDGAGCCGFAGDRGMLHRELTESATAAEAAEVRERGPFDAYVSANRMCEVGMDHVTDDAGYRSIILELDRATR
ncbi:FAD-binding oxidoreductase [Mangrovactinospora gilvigrisea]|uniref:D-lactate dehydrogenase (cytochrome) n=1 Tax=Mangrovactinospora gilvigrisea TaxID=1428644 RepID=A0A1J7CBK6_9ACTN|nr:FAD-binding and (Fe-S)-binding domain-containing protein [Mangrovactinospora gilvigrisea]OIV38900.1 FAD-binding oxidoreductase [Mangrovactinospora gilvigrisea]